MAIRFPHDPHFHELKMFDADYKNWHEEMAHDPSLLEWEGKFYAFSTDTVAAPHGYQIRESNDLLHWKYCGRAFNIGKSEKERKEAGLQEAYEWSVTAKREADGICAGEDGSIGLWAPHCVRGSDGKFWLFYCLTGYFGGSKSCIGIAKSSRPTGPFVGEKLLVCSPAGWRTPNAIDPQFFTSPDGRAFLIYGSYGMGLFILELDPQTGHRKDGLCYDDYARRRADFSQYYGVNVARGSVEGGVVRYHENVPVLENGKWVSKNYYYLACSYGSLSSVYHIRTGRSERPEGPYLDGNGNTLVCSTDIGTGNKLLASFCWENDPVDRFCPGHNDLFVTESGVNLVSYHCRTEYFKKRGMSKSSNFHFLYLGQYAFNSDGWLVMNANRYAGEALCAITAEELLRYTGGKFEAVLFSQGTKTVRGKRVTLHPDGTLSGALCGSWKMYGKNYVSLTVDKEEYLGVAMPCWIDHRGAAGIAISALGKTSDMALHLNAVANALD